MKTIRILSLIAIVPMFVIGCLFEFCVIGFTAGRGFVENDLPRKEGK